jgi:hypothetical protein
MPNELFVTLNKSSNEYLKYPCQGWLELFEVGVDGSVITGVWRGCNLDGSVAAPVEVRDIEFLYVGVNPKFKKPKSPLDFIIIRREKGEPSSGKFTTFREANLCLKNWQDVTPAKDTLGHVNYLVSWKNDMYYKASIFLEASTYFNNIDIRANIKDRISFAKGEFSLLDMPPRNKKELATARLNGEKSGESERYRLISDTCLLDD